jgi:hypothetical protein
MKRARILAQGDELPSMKLKKRFTTKNTKRTKKKAILRPGRFLMCAWNSSWPSW